MAELRADVAIVGAGVLGAAHALAALRRGARVLVCERSERPRGASVRNFGMLWPIGQSGADLALALRSGELWREIAPLAGIRLRSCGSLHVARAEDEAQVLSEFVAASTLPGLQLLEPAAALALFPQLEPQGLVCALHSPHEANVDPPRALEALHAWLAAQGVAYVWGRAAVRARSGALELAGGAHVAAERIVVCSGDDFATLFPEQFAASDVWRSKLQMLSLESDSGPDDAPMLAAGLTLLHYRGFAACPSLPRLRERLAHECAEHVERGVHVLVSRGDDGRWIVGDSHEYGTHFAPGLDSRTEQLILEYLVRFVRLPVERVQRRWSGSYALRRGGATLLSAEPLRGVEIVTAAGGSGMTRSLAVGEQTVKAWDSTAQIRSGA